MVTFYKNAFDLLPEPSSDPGYIVMKSNAGAGIALHALPVPIAECIQLTSPPQWREQTAYKVCFEVADIEAQRARILEHGGQAKEPWEWEGIRFCECTDVEGNVIQIFKRP
jgi:predicted enzyme related to lactoylglutathione lyase